MEVKFKDILNFTGIRVGDKKFPARMQIAVIGNAEECQAALKTYSEVYDKMAQEHAKKDEEGNPMKGSDGGYIIEDPEAWEKALEELDETTKEIPITTVPVEVFERCCEDPNYDTPTVGETAAMKFFIEM